MSRFSSRSIVLLLAIVFVVGVAAIGCAPAEEEVEDPEDPVEEPEDPEDPEDEPDPDEPDETEIVWAVGEAVCGWLPEQTTGSGYSVPARVFMEGLYRMDIETAEPTPSLAKDMPEISEDGLVWTIELHEGIQWHHGYGELTAEDVAFSLNRHIDPDVESVHTETFWAMDEAVAVDDYTVELHLNAPYGGLLYSLTLMHPGWGGIISKAAFEDLGIEGLEEKPVGAGPYVFNADEYIPREELVFDAFEDYFKGEPEIDRVRMPQIEDSSTLAMAMEAREIDMTSLRDVPVWEEYSSRVDHIDGYTFDEIHITKMDITTINEPWDDPRGRWAVAHAIDREAIRQIVYEGYGLVPDANILHPDMMHVEDIGIDIEHDVDRSHELFAELGLEPDDVEGTGCTYGSAEYRNFAEVMNTSFAEAGYDIVIEPLERGAFHEQRSSVENDFVVIAHPRWPDPDPFLALVHGNAIPPDGINFCWWDGADDLIDKSRVTEGDERTEVVTEIQHVLSEEMPQVPLFHRQGFILATDRVGGITMGPGFHFDPFQLYIEE